MKLLILGGTIFLGRHLVTAARARGHIDCRKALHAGLTFRPLAETVRDTLAWAVTRPADHAWRAGLTPEREAELLARWQAQG